MSVGLDHDALKFHLKVLSLVSLLYRRVVEMKIGFWYLLFSCNIVAFVGGGFTLETLPMSFSDVLSMLYFCIVFMPKRLCHGLYSVVQDKKFDSRLF